MAKVASKFLFLFFLSLLTVCSSRTPVGFSYTARRNIVASSLGRSLSILKLNKISPSSIRVFNADHRAFSSLSNTGVSIDLYLNERLLQNLINSESSAILWLKTQVVTFLPHVNIKSITVSGSNDLSKLLSTLKSIHSVLSSSHVDKEVKISVAFSLTFLENLNRIQENDPHKIFEFIRKTRSFVNVEANIDIDVKLGMEDLLFQLMIQKATLATSLLPSNDVPMVMTIKSLLFRRAKEVAEFKDKFSKFLGNSRISAQEAELHAEVSSAEDFANKEIRREQEQIFRSSRRELLNNFKTTLHDNLPTTIFPTTPASTPPVTLLPDNPTPTIVTVPATNPVSVIPANPVSTPIPVPSTTPVTVPCTNPSVNSPVPVTNPVTTPAPITVPGVQPATNPVTTYPAPVGNIPVTTPVTNPVSPPATTNAPAVPGQSWCVAKSGALDTALQSALDYACGMGGADCSQIQQGGSCYNPNTVQNHASYAFNSYYQKNPSPTSCDFGGTATIVNINPSTGSCIYPSSSSTSSMPAPSTSYANPTTTTTSSPPATGATSAPPSVLNSSNPASLFGSETPPAISTSTSKSANLQPMISFVLLLASFVARIILKDM